MFEKGMLFLSFDFIKDKHMKIHFIGIGGVSMSGLAAVLLNNGYKVSGSDFKESKAVKKLKDMGAEIYIGHSADNLKNVDLVVYTAAIPSDNPELLEAKKKGGKSYSESNTPTFDSEGKFTGSKKR